MKCPKCHFENPADTLYRVKCGTKLDLSEPFRGIGPTNNKISVAQTETLQAPIKELTRGTTFAGRYDFIEELGKYWKGKAIEHYEKFLDLWKEADPGISEVTNAKKQVAALQNQ